MDSDFREPVTIGGLASWLVVALVFLFSGSVVIDLGFRVGEWLTWKLAGA